ncbi:hypothetical protein D9758_007163 [Tetrapyrgos nigripes]|uniref:Phosphoglucomutase n=1 Tax=Tetrapyrgos nigripes TaxID=182062 RepID=A0A8H5FWJ6_9AGAR|nr:hypothetical protein D9758_007163 [Tetrapyrgos nigripes]
MSLKELVDAWMSMDQNEQTRSEIQSLWDKSDTDALERRMRNRIEFGTAGLRGRMQAGWSSMNDLIVIQASQGLCHYVLKQIENASSKGIVIGHDHRHNSERWAKLTAAAFLKNGVKVYLHQGLVHTPMVPFTVKRVGAACGVMITASHNPKHDNGYKVYWENAVQIISPHDKGISDSIKVNLEPQTWDTGLIESPLSLNVTDEMKQAYFMSLLDLKNLQLPLSRRCKFINTSMHGVGHPFVEKALGMLGISIIPVPEQQHPDPEFPTVSYPNPEEKGALDLAIAVAKRQQQKEEVVILAQDPDADRFTAVEKQLNGEWVTFTGDQVGVIFAGQVMEAYRASGKPMSKLAMVASTVSSKMVEAMAEVEGFKFVECLTGFKYIGNTALDLVAQGFEVPFGYEEAIGFMFGSEVRDKDGVAASVMFAQIAEILHSQGKTVKSYLDELYKRYGYFKTNNSYFICNEPATIDKIFARIRNFNVPYIVSSAGSKSRLNARDAAHALLAVKTLGKNPSGSEYLATAPALSTFLSLANSFRDDIDASCEALRCIANTMLLFEQARRTLTTKEVGGGEAVLAMLEKAITPDQLFILSRILFLATASPSSFLISLIEDKRHGRNVIDIISLKLDTAMISILSGQRMAREAMTDLLKFTFNLLLHYPKLAESESQANGTKGGGDLWHPRLDAVLSPLLRVYHTLPPTFPAPLIAPLTHAIHTLITIPITPSLRPLWYGRSQQFPSGRASLSGYRPKSKSYEQQRSTTSSSTGSLSVTPTSESPISSPGRAHTPPKPSTLDRALSVLSAGRRPMSRSPSPNAQARRSMSANSSPSGMNFDVVLRTQDLLEISFMYYFPSNTPPDDLGLRESFKKDLTTAGISPNTTLDDILSPLVVLATRLCKGDGQAKWRMREWIIPEDLDRTGPLVEREDFLGRCLRLLSSVHHKRLKESVGELLYAVSDSDPSTLAALFGYGHVAGFLFNKGVMSAPPPPTTLKSGSLASREINPMTGTYTSAVATATPAEEMTEEEKEQEMEKLFVLFDRLEKTGSLPPNQNPVHKAIERSSQ